MGRLSVYTCQNGPQLTRTQGSLAGFFFFSSMCGSNGSLQLPVCCKLPKVHWQHCVFKAFEFSVSELLLENQAPPY